jgi:hypothetical protein
MSQGKEYNKAEIMESLKPYFQLGYSIPDACDFVGIDNSTLYKWIKEDDTLSKKIKGWRNEISVMARDVWRKKITDERDYDASREWLKKKDRKEFGDNVDVTTDGDKIMPTTVEWVIQNPDDQSK